MKSFGSIAQQFSWFAERQLKFAIAIAALVVLISLFDLRNAPTMVGAAALALAAICVGDRLFDSESASDWVSFSFLPRVAGGLLLLFGWSIMLRIAVVAAISTLISKSY